MELLPRFEWQRPVRGRAFYWDQSVRGFLRKFTGLGRRVEIALKAYYPLQEETGLFLTFAAIPPTRQAVVDFANLYGTLELLPEVVPTDRNGLGERFSLWTDHIVLLKELVSLWELVKHQDERGLAPRIRWFRNREVRYLMSPENAALIRSAAKEGAKNHLEVNGLIASRDITPEEKCMGFVLRSISPSLKEFDTWIPGEVLRPAIHYLLKSVSEAMDPHAYLRLTWDFQACQGRPTFGVHNLLGALWLQFYLAIAENKAYRPCVECGKVFESTRGVSRDDRVLCGHRCRIRAYRRRQEEARQLHAQGKTVKQIVKALDVRRIRGMDPIKIVTRWISDNKGGN
jgi:hypothetical protein